MFLFPRSRELSGNSYTRTSTRGARDFCAEYNQIYYAGADATDDLAGFSSTHRTTSTPDNNDKLRDPHISTQGRPSETRQLRPDSARIADAVIAAATARAGREGNVEGESKTGRPVQCTRLTRDRCNGNTSSNGNNYSNNSGKGTLVYTFTPEDGKLRESTALSLGSVPNHGESLSPATTPTPIIQTNSVGVALAIDDTASLAAAASAPTRSTPVTVTTSTATKAQYNAGSLMVPPQQLSTETLAQTGERAESNEAVRCETWSALKSYETTCGAVGGISEPINNPRAAVVDETMVAANIVRIKDTIDVVPVDFPLPGVYENALVRARGAQLGGSTHPPYILSCHLLDFRRSRHI